MYDFVLAFDFETTGFSSKKDELLEFGAVLFDLKSEEKHTFNQLVTVTCKIPSRITDITGIDIKILSEEGSKPIKEALVDFLAFSKVESAKVLFVGHNIFAFDLNFLKPLLKRFRFTAIKDYDCWDTLLQTRADIAKKKASNFRRLQKEAKTYKTKDKVNLIAACEFYKIETCKPNHRALPDAENVFSIFKKQIKLRKWRV